MDQLLDRGRAQIRLIESDQIVATADSVILDGCSRWLNLARRTVDRHVPGLEPVDLSES